MQSTKNQNNHQQYAGKTLEAVSLKNHNGTDSKITDGANHSQSSKATKVSGSVERNEVLDKAFNQYLKSKVRSGEPIPIEVNRKGYAPNREKICTEIHKKFGIYLSPDAFLLTGWFAEKLKQLCAVQLKDQGKSTPTKEEKRLALAQENTRQRKLVSNLENWLDELKKSGCKLKAFRLCDNQTIDYVWIFEQTGIPYAHLAKKTTLCHQRLKKAKKEIGFEVFTRGLDFIPNEYTYQKLLDFGTDCRKVEVEGNNNSRAQVANTRLALKQFVEGNDLSLDSKIGPEFGLLFQESLEKTAAGMNKQNSKKTFVHQIKKWQPYYQTLLQNDILPADFAGALRFIIEASGKTYRDIERLNTPAKACHGTISNWVNYGRSPSILQLPFIHKIEKHFQLPHNTLVGRATFAFEQKVVKSFLTKNFPEIPTSKVNMVIRKLPANFSLLPFAVQKTQIETLWKSITENQNPQRQKHTKLIQSRYRLQKKDFPAGLVEEINILIQFKTCDEDDLLDGYERHNDGWTEDPDKQGSVKIFIAVVETIFGILLSLPGEEAGTLALKKEDLSLSLLALPNTWKAYEEFLRERNDGELPATTAENQIKLVSTLIKPEFGWITQSPWLAKKLRPINGLLTCEEAAKAKKDWVGFLEDLKPAFSKFLRRFKKNRLKASGIRKSFIPILPILESEDPLKIVLDAVDEFQKKIPSRDLNPGGYAIALRNTIFLRVLTETALRRKNMVHITWNKQNTGHLRRNKEGNYYLIIPHTEFKNANSSFFGAPGDKHPYEAPLSKKLTPLIDEYLNYSRQFQIARFAGERGMRDDGFFFIGEARETKQGLNSEARVSLQRITLESASILVRTFSEDFLVYNPLTGTGVEGVQCFRIHSIRHVTATHMLKKTGSYEKAGNSIQDTARTAELFYSRYGPAEKQKSTRSIVLNLVDGED